MNLNRKSLPWLAVLVLAGLSVWYFFLKNWDYRIYFTVKSSPGVVYQNVRDWNIWNRRLLHDNFQVTGRDPWKSVDTRIMLPDTTLEFHWKFRAVNDSMTRVRVSVTDPERKLENRVRLPFKKTPFKKSLFANVRDVKDKLEVVNESFGFEFVGEDAFAPTPCVYISTKSTYRGKAREMMNNVIELNQFVRENELGLDGHPFLLVHDQRFDDDTIRFDFCFPVKHPEKIPEHPFIRHKTVELDKALKGNFYGNYSISDMSWYLMAEEVEKRGAKANGIIIERYHNDPHSGGNDLKWKAEIFMGIR